MALASEAASISRPEQLSIVHIDHDQLFKAAAEGNIEPFVGNGRQDLRQIVQEISGDTILHFYIKSRKRLPRLRELVSVGMFTEKILGICPLLLQQVNAKGDTPLHVAAKFGHPAIVEFLLRHAKAQPEDRERGDWKLLRMTNNEMNTPLHEAVLHNHLDVVKILTRESDSGFSYYPNKAEETPLFLAAARGSECMVSLILKSCTSAAHEGPKRKTALHAAVMNNKSSVTEQILKEKSSLTKEIDQHGWTPLHYAAYYGCFSSAKLLLKYDKSAAYIADKDRKMTPLHMAASQRNIHIMVETLSHCPECYEQVDDRGWNLLHFAAASSRYNRSVWRLTNNPLVMSLINQKDNKGNTPCHLFAFSNRSFCRSILKFDGGYIEALNDENVSVQEILSYGPPDKLKTELEELDKDKGKGQYPLGVISKTPRAIKQQQGLSQNEEAREKFLIVATLIATVTFTTAFTIPGGYKSEGQHQGTAILATNSTFQAFIIVDALAMIASLSAVFLISIMSFTEFKYYYFMFYFSFYLTLFAMGAMVVAFITGIYAVLAPSSEVTNAVCIIVLSFILVILFMLFGRLFKFWEEEKVSNSR